MPAKRRRSPEAEAVTRWSTLSEHEPTIVDRRRLTSISRDARPLLGKVIEIPVLVGQAQVWIYVGTWAFNTADAPDSVVKRVAKRIADALEFVPER